MLKEVILLVRFPKKTLQTQENVLYVVHGTPFVTKDIQTDAAREVNIRMVDRSFEEHSGRRVRVVVGERKGELECQALIGRF